MTLTELRNKAVKACEEEAQRVYKVFPWSVISAVSHDNYSVVVRFGIARCGKMYERRVVLDAPMAAEGPGYVRSMFDDLMRAMTLDLAE